MGEPGRAVWRLDRPTPSRPGTPRFSPPWLHLCVPRGAGALGGRGSPSPAQQRLGSWEQGLSVKGTPSESSSDHLQGSPGSLGLRLGREAAQRASLPQHLHSLGGACKGGHTDAEELTTA
ncbi:hypothetical protein KIL84_002877 [Mauremys mutica]|uniref:Uncharacterized protein n=1 Tax=Mauremys mutica TaxID=74926 RepID=A0A9D3WNK5_9SAUR|nr:hypothetical protein KIL84_002877 [Mauremys mutica]